MDENRQRDIETEELSNCRAITIFFPALIIGYIGLSLLIGQFCYKAEVELPLWSTYILGQVCILIPVLLYMLLFRKYIPKGISYKRLHPKDILLSLLTGYAMIPTILFLSSISQIFVTNYLEETVETLTYYPFMLQLILIAVIPAFVEEFVFRGLFFHTYKKAGVIAGAIVSSLIFALIHLNINQFCYAIVMGVVFSCLVEATGSMWASVLAHFAVNTYSISVIKLLEIFTDGNLQQTSQISEEVQQISNSSMIIQLCIMGVFAAAFMGLAISMIRRMAVRNGRLENLNWSPGTVIAGLKKLFTWPFVVVTVFIFAYMIYLG